MKKHRALLLLTAFLCACSLCGADKTIGLGRWKVTYSTVSQTFSLTYLMANGTDLTVVKKSVPEAVCYTADHQKHNLRSTDFAHCKVRRIAVRDSIGQGRRLDFIFSGSRENPDIQLIQHIWLYKGKDWLLTSLELKSPTEVSSNYMSPVYCDEGWTLFDGSPHNRILKVPFDNDGFVRYERRPMKGETTSYEVTSLYEGDSRRGIVLGSIDHLHWKSAVSIKAVNDGDLQQLKVFSGVADKETRDVLPHGRLRGRNIQSARFLIGYFPDWRDGMETFAQVCNQVSPGKHDWTEGRPVGWMTWNVLETHNNYTDDSACFRYICDSLQTAGFLNGKGRNIISIDAWDNLRTEDERNLTQQASQSNQLVGCYSNPFCLWWNTRNTGDLNNIFYNDVKGKEVVLCANGNPIVYDGAYCLDPTHPAVKARNAEWIRQKYNLGYRYFKLDFVDNGIMEADRWYNPEVHTGVEAYNEGFQAFLACVDSLPESVFVDLSISPLFPSQYANARRQLCDTWGTIDQTEYSMNAITDAWWTNRLYQYNDPDGLPLVGHGNQEGTTLEESRSRLMSGIVSGSVLLADNFSLGNQSGRGNPVKSRERARLLLTNPDINRMLRLEPDFRPVFGTDEFEGKAGGAGQTVMMKVPEGVYLVVFNYSKDKTITASIPNLSSILVRDAQSFHIKELWSGEEWETKDSIHYTLQPRDCKVFLVKSL